MAYIFVIAAASIYGIYKYINSTSSGTETIAQSTNIIKDDEPKNIEQIINIIDHNEPKTNDLVEMVVLKNEDWFETTDEPIPVKSRHLILTNFSTLIDLPHENEKNKHNEDKLKNPDFTKFVKSPWLQSTIEPDFNIKSWC